MKANKKPIEKHCCEECALAEYDWQFANLSVDGKPTLVSCLFSGDYKKVVNEPACENFVAKPQQNIDK